MNAPVQYGLNVKALGVHLTQGQMLPYARAAEPVADLYGLSVSPATLLGWVTEANTALLGTAERIADQLRGAAVLHGDESGLRVAGKLHWLHVAATDNLTWYGVHGKRGLAAMQAQDILTRHEGVLVHDCWAPYWKLEGVTHALCNAHLLRVVAPRERDHRPGLGATHEPFPARRQQTARRDAVKARGGAFSPDEVQAFRALFDDIVREGEVENPGSARADGARGKQSTAVNLLRRFRLHADAVLRFIRDFRVPFTNNEAKRAVRMPKVKQKISGGFRTLEGAEHFCVIRSVLDTLRKQGHSMFTVLQRAFLGNPIPSVA